MANKKPIHVIAKDLGIDTKKVINACNQLGIYAKGASKRLDYKEEEKVITFFNDGKNVANEIIDINISTLNETEIKKEFPIKSTKNIYFPNRLIKEI
tara:strand:+ start:246 stop:536 length:291 start_codon:yes stop_codon:yes gene_type:complete